MDNFEKYKSDIDRLITRGNNLHLKIVIEARPEVGELFKKKNPERYKAVTNDVDQFSAYYQQWYSEAHELVRQLLPSRLADFEEYYKGKGTRKELTYASYTIKDALNGLQVTRGYEKEKVVGVDAAINLVEQQVKIIEAIKQRFTSSLFDIKTLVHADILDDEISEAEVLLRNGYIRAAGALCGVALESHLKTVVEQHGISIGKKRPSLADYNDALKDTVIDMVEWRKIQYLIEVRNNCDHKKTKEPTSEDLEQLIAGVKRVIKNIF